MNRDPMVEVFELDPEARWKYLRRFYDEAMEFYEARESVVDEVEVAETIRRFKEKPAPRIRKLLRLTEWAFTPDLRNEGLAGGFYSFAHDAADATLRRLRRPLEAGLWSPAKEGAYSAEVASATKAGSRASLRSTSWEQVTAPHSFNHVPADPVKFDKDTYLGEYRTWYRARVPSPKLRGDEVAYLCFDSIHLLSDVWVNEEAVMAGHLGPYPFRIGVTRELRRAASEEALIAVRVTYLATNQPWFFNNGLQVAYAGPEYWGGVREEDWQGVGWSGMAGEAALLVLHETHLEEAFFVTTDLGEGRADVVCRLTVRNTSRRPFAGQVRIEITEWLPEESDTISTVRHDVAVLPTSESVLEVPFTLSEPRLWSIESPNLYLARVILEGVDGRELDDQVETFGVRIIRMVGPHFYLNNEKIVPRGTHDLTHYLGDSMICPSDRSIVTDLLLHKHLGATCSRWPSDTRMHYARIADYCDQSGFLLSWCGFFEMWKVHPEMELYAQRDVKAVVRSLRNHPSIIFWEMGDEPLMGRDNFRRMRWYEQVYDLVAAEDQSRPIIPAGWYADDDLVELIVGAEDQSLSLQERRERVVSENPVFARELAVWDYHYCPAAGPLREPLHRHVDRVAAALGGAKPTVLTEFGMDALPQYDKVRDVYGWFRWASYGIMSIDRRKCDLSFFGRDITEEDWRETQACQALFHGTIIDRIRARPREFGAFYLVTMTDVWTFYWGLTDVRFNPKLSYFVAKALYAPVCVSALHGNTVLRNGDRLQVTASNFGPPQEGATLELRIKDDAGATVRDATFGPTVIEGDMSVTTLGALEVSGLAPGLYRVESLLRAGGALVAKRMEMFYLREPARAKRRCFARQ